VKALEKKKINSFVPLSCFWQKKLLKTTWLQSYQLDHIEVGFSLVTV